MYVCMYVCMYIHVYMYVCMYLVRPTNRPYVHLGLRVPNLCRVLKYLNTKMATITYGSNYLPQTASNEQVFEQNTVETSNNNDRGSTVKERKLATTLPST